MDKSKFQYEALKWMYELEMLNSPQIINQLKLNILLVSKRIKDAEFLIYRENKQMLVLLQLTWVGRKFFKRVLFEEVYDVLSQLLPSFNFRVTDDPKIMNMAVAKVKQALTGGKNESPNNNIADTDKSASSKQSDSVSTSDSDNKVSTESDSEKQSEITETVRVEVSSDDSKKE